MDKKIQAIIKNESHIIGLNKIDDEHTLISISPEISVAEKSIVYPIQEISSKCISLPKLSIRNICNMMYLDEGTRGIIHLGKLWGSLVVVKSSTSNSNTANNELENEKTILERLSHRNIVKILGLGNVPRQFIVLEFLDGETLDEFISKKYCTQSNLWLRKILHLPKKKYSLNFNDAVDISRQIVSALEYLHDKFHPDVMIIHRDLKPQNIMVTPNGCVKIIDFGLATAVRKSSPGSTKTLYSLQGCTGSLRYMAPEVALSQPYNEKADIYSFGILLWQIGTGKLPFAGFSLEKLVIQVIQGGLRPEIGGNGNGIGRSKVEIDPIIADICQWCFHSESARRPSATELLQTFSTIINNQALAETLL